MKYLLTLFCSILLTGCLVDADETATVHTPPTENLHVYKAGDFIEYTVSGQRTTAPNQTSSISGTLRVEWNAHDVLEDPITQDTIEVLAEITQLSINNEITETKRYISQDDDGTMYLHAFDNNLTEFYWIDTESSEPPTGFDKVKILQSPFLFNHSENITYYLFDKCDGDTLPNCYIGRHTEIQTVVDKLRQSEIRRGIFNTYRVRIESGIKQLAVGVPNFPTILDIRSSCSLEDAVFDGYAEYYPDAGIIYQFMSCTAQDGTSRGFSYYLEYDRAGGTISLP